MKKHVSQLRNRHVAPSVPAFNPTRRPRNVKTSLRAGGFLDDASDWLTDKTNQVKDWVSGA
jgi:hypothetical protein